VWRTSSRLVVSGEGGGMQGGDWAEMLLRWRTKKIRTRLFHQSRGKNNGETGANDLYWD